MGFFSSLKNILNKKPQQEPQQQQQEHDISLTLGVS